VGGFKCEDGTGGGGRGGGREGKGGGGGWEEGREGGRVGRREGRRGREGGREEGRRFIFATFFSLSVSTDSFASPIGYSRKWDTSYDHKKGRSP
jgi:hypothetical protein